MTPFFAEPFEHYREGRRRENRAQLKIAPMPLGELCVESRTAAAKIAAEVLYLR